MEYIWLIGILVASLFVLSIYISRGFQGKIRGLSDQMGDQYSPGNISVGTIEKKRVLTNTISTSISTVVYGSTNGSSPDITTSTSNTVDDTTEETSKYSNEVTGPMSNDLWP